MSENRISGCPLCGATLSSRAFPPPEDRVITADPSSIARSGSAFYSDDEQRAPFDWTNVVLLSCLCGVSAGAIGTMLYVCWRLRQTKRTRRTKLLAQR